MIPISNDFKTAMKQPVKEIQAYLGDIKSEDDLISFEISCEAGLCKTAMRKLKATFTGEHNLLGQEVHVGYGVKLSNGAFEYLDYGSFLITEITNEKDTEITTITGYDKMVNSMKAYQPLIIDYPINLYDYTKLLCEECKLELGNESFVIHNDWQINGELWENIDGITYRDIFVQIAQATGTTCIISNDDKIYFKPLTNCNDSITYDNMFSLKLEPKYGEINSLVLARTPQEDLVVKRDEESIKTNSLTEFRIENNIIIDNDRETAKEALFEVLNGVNYYPFETKTEGLGWFEIGDTFNIINDTGDAFNVSLFNFTINIDGAINETLRTSAETKTQSQYQYASSIAKRVKNTEIIVNKQEEYIKNLVSDVYEENGVINKKFTEVYQDIENIVYNVQNSGGSNLIKNSVMFAYDTEGIPTDWETSEAGNLIISSNAESLNVGGLSGHSFTLVNKAVSQKITVSDNLYYSFSTKIKKSAAGTCYVKIYNSNEEYIIDIPNGEEVFYEEYTIKELLPKDSYYIIEFYGSTDSDATFTDNILTTGKYASNWCQANGETMNTQVNINLDGVLVKSTVYQGDYTVMSPLEFAGYSNINGSITKVFTLNKDTTYMTKAEVKDEFKMIPIKIVPVTTGERIGWAFVPATREEV